MKKAKEREREIREKWNKQREISIIRPMKGQNRQTRCDCDYNADNKL